MFIPVSEIKWRQDENQDSFRTWYKFFFGWSVTFSADANHIAVHLLALKILTGQYLPCFFPSYTGSSAFQELTNCHRMQTLYKT